MVATLAGLLLIVAGIVGSHPRPSDGKWQPLSPSVRAGLTVVGLVVILGGWATNQGWFKAPPSTASAAAPRYSDARGDRPTDTLWNEAEVAEREARQHPRPSLPPTANSLPAMPQAEPVAAAPTPALEPVPAPAPQALAAPPATPAPAPAAAAPASVTAAPAAPAAAPTTRLAAAPTASPAACNCDQPGAARPAAPRPASRPRSLAGSRGRNAGGGDIVSVCALQQQYGIAPASSASDRIGNTRSGGTASLRVQDRLGPDQRREQLRISIDGGASATLNLGPSNSSGSVSLRAPRDGARYRLSGFTEYRDGRRVPLSGEGVLDGDASRYELRLADESGGAVFLEPAS
ncbi:hypothetical protein [Hydrocarboniphaga sp.]|uniref:hypothetical protein n=1 Tax=Hydrocarboniphaga sp. TaxID=2033016 RepID=UPI003D0EE4A4